MEKNSLKIECILEHKEGTAKNGKPYNFYVLRFPEARASIILKNFGDYDHYKIKNLLKGDNK